MDGRALTENDFSNDPGTEANPEKDHVVTFLENPNAPSGVNLTGDLGNDVFNYNYNKTVNHTICWEDDDPGAMHSMELIDSEGSQVLSVQANGDCVTQLIEAGSYVVRIHHDGRAETTHPIFVIPGRSWGLGAKIDETINGGMLARAVGVLSNILERLDISIAQTTNAQTTAEDNIMTLISTSSCSECDLTGADLSGKVLIGVNLEDAILHDADLSGSNLRNTNANGADFSGADLSCTFFALAELEDANLSGAKVSRTDFIEADLTGADLSGVDGRNTIFRDANMTGADFTGANLPFAEFSFGADLTNANLSMGTFTFSEFNGNVSNINLSGAVLELVDLSGADLSGVDLSGANLTSADLSGANLTSANLSMVNLNAANLNGANLSMANLSGAVWCTGFPACKCAADSTGSCVGCPPIDENCTGPKGVPIGPCPSDIPCSPTEDLALICGEQCPATEQECYCPPPPVCQPPTG